MAAILKCLPRHLLLRPSSAPYGFVARHVRYSTTTQAPQDAVKSTETVASGTESLTDPDALNLLHKAFPARHQRLSGYQSDLLAATLHSHIPSRKIDGSLPRSLLLPGYHYAYFSGPLEESELSHDGYDENQGPGGDWTRRMWAGGELLYPQSSCYDSHKSRADLMLGSKFTQENVVENIVMKGSKGSLEEKMFVTFKRQTYHWKTHVTAHSLSPLVERRTIVYMKGTAEKTKVQQRILKPPHAADFYFTLTPTSTLLFRFSALTFNAHKIHIDRKYAQEVEHHPDLICHGPLLVVLLLEFLRVNVTDLSGFHISAPETPDSKIGPILPNLCLQSFTYKNLLPLYVDRPIKLCGRKVKDMTYELWAETPEGSYAVKGTAILQGSIRGKLDAQVMLEEEKQKAIDARSKPARDGTNNGKIKARSMLEREILRMAKYDADAVSAKQKHDALSGKFDKEPQTADQ